MKKPWEKRLPALLVLVLALFVAQFLYSKQKYKPGNVYIITRPSGAMISLPQSNSVMGFQVKPLVKSPGPIPLSLKEQSKFTFVFDLPGYKQAMRQATEEALRSGIQVDLEPKIPILVPAVYWLRDYAFFVLAVLLVLGFGVIIVRPQRIARAKQEKLWDAGKLVPGLMFNEYRLVRKLGEGGAGSVFLSDKPNENIGLQYAVKILLGNSASPEEFEHECSICRDLNHSGIVSLLDWGEVREHRYIVFDFVNGETLDRKNELPLKEVCGWAHQVFKALCFAHKKGVVHRDIKPGNILVTSQGVAKILDFGIAASLDTEEQKSAGTSGYMAPEQINGVVNPSCDFYSLGITIYRLVGGKMPFDGEGFFQVLAAQAQGDFTPLDELNELCPKSLAELVSLLLKPGPDDRLTDPATIESYLMDSIASFTSAAD